MKAAFLSCAQDKVVASFNLRKGVMVAAAFKLRK